MNGKLSSGYPAWGCLDCGKKYGRRDAGICTIHKGKCGICGEEKMVTEPRDFGHLKYGSGWEKK
ncbi:MAG: hypothetical protein KGL39_39355 [Patescibacteria group bacterium]|nr:hypothetical protein [Patescibacteria group bacterium]